jgi:glycosyltransferase involved in cell wall biosynthesis
MQWARITEAQNIIGEGIPSEYGSPTQVASELISQLHPEPSHKWDIVEFHKDKCGIKVASDANCSALHSVVGGNRRVWSVDFEQNAEITYLHQNPNRAVLRNFTLDRRRLIGFWAWETDRCTDEWIALSEAYSEIWVPSWFVAKSLIASGIKTPIKVIPHAITPRAIPTKSEIPRFLVQFDGESRIERKLPHVAIAAIIMGLDGQNGVINIKTHNFRHFAKLLAMINKLTLEIPKNIKINIIDGWTDDQSYWDVDCYVSASRGEGFGLPAVEAMASRVAVIAVGCGAVQEYLDNQNGYSAPYSLVDAASCGDPYFKTGCWAEPDFDGMVLQVKKFLGDMRNGELETILDRAKLTAERYSSEALVQKIREAVT